MADYSYGQLEQLWIQAGGSRAMAPLMAAIALAESHGDPNAINPDDNGGSQTSWGLWQISNGTHAQPVDGILTPLTNAQAAVAKYKSQGLNAWGTYDSGAYQQYYQGSVPPSSLPQGGSGGGQDSSGSGTPATDLSWNIPGPLGLPGDIVNGIDSLWSSAGGIKNSADALTQIARGFTVLLKSFEWLFVPSHWVRIFAFGFGLLFLIPGLYALMRSASGGYGDVTLGLGILLITLAGICLFIAFHNLPTDVQNFGQLLQWISASIREGKPATETTDVQTV